MFNKAKKEFIKDANKAFYKEDVKTPKMGRPFIKFAAVLTALLIITTGTIPLIKEHMNPHPATSNIPTEVFMPFMIVANAQEIDMIEGKLHNESLDKLILDTAEVVFPTGKLRRGMGFSAGDNSYKKFDVFWQTGTLSCTGDDIESIKFEAEKGDFSMFDTISLHPMSYDEEIFNFRQHYIISKEISSKIRNLIDNESYDEFYDYFRSGEMDHIIGEEMRNKIVEAYDNGDNRFAISADITDSNGYQKSDMGYHMGGEVGLTYPTGEEHYELQIYDMSSEIEMAGDLSADIDSTKYWSIGKIVEVAPGQSVYYTPPLEVMAPVAKIEKIDEEIFTFPNNVKYEELEHDTLTITATFIDGRVETQKIDLFYNEEGNLCGKLIVEK